MTFVKSLVLIKDRMLYAIYMPPNTKDLAINQMMVAYGNRQNAIAFARVNHTGWLRPPKNLMETGLTSTVKFIVKSYYTSNYSVLPSSATISSSYKR